jgi:hypothetical protein
MKNEEGDVKELRRQKRELEKALVDAKLKTIALESLIECVEEHYNIDVKKNFGQQVSKRASAKSKDSGSR